MYKLCKTERSADRQRQMEYGLLELMNSTPYEEISVSDLCQYMQVPRKSFYRYFSSKDGALHALLDHTMIDYDGFHIIYADHERRALEKELARFFQFWMQQKLLLEALAKNNMSGKLVERAMHYVLSSDANSSRSNNDQAQYVRKQVSLFCISGLMSMVLTWHMDGYPKQPEEMATIIADLVCQPLFPNMQNYF